MAKGKALVDKIVGLCEKASLFDVLTSSDIVRSELVELYQDIHTNEPGILNDISLRLNTPHVNVCISVLAAIAKDAVSEWVDLIN